MLGGYSNFGSGSFASKSFDSLPPFFKVRILIRIYKIDRWDSEVLNVYMNSALIFKSSPLDVFMSVYTGDQCGNTANEKSESIFMEFDVNQVTSLTIKIETNLDQENTDESWGFSAFALSVLRCGAGCKICTDIAQCQICLMGFIYILETKDISDF
jgi:hypothetical protein